MRDFGLDDMLIFLAVQWGVFMILAVYFELGRLASFFPPHSFPSFLCLSFP
jgi:MFS superfamily sulfate permease-like transporter